MKKIGLALSSGATRGAFLPGVLRVLTNAGIHIDMVAGSSVGSLGAIGVGMEYSPDFIEKWTGETKFWQYIRPELKDDLGVLNCDAVLERVTKVVGNLQFSDFKIPVAMVALDAETSEVAVFDNGTVIDALRASIGAPSIFPPFRKNNHYYIDAGLSDPLPVDVIRNMGADFVIALDQGPVGKMKIGFLKEKTVHVPIVNEINHIRSSWAILNHAGGMLHRTAINRAIKIKKPDFVISVAKALEKDGIGDIGFTDTACFTELCRLGEKATLAVVDDILKAYER